MSPFLLQNIKTSSGTHPPSCLVDTPGHEVSYSLPSITEVQNEWSCTSTPPVCLQGVHRGSFTFSPFSFFTSNQRPRVQKLWVEVWDRELQLLFVIQTREERHNVLISSTTMLLWETLPILLYLQPQPSYDMEEEILRWVLLLKVLQAEWVYTLISALNHIRSLTFLTFPKF